MSRVLPAVLLITLVTVACGDDGAGRSDPEPPDATAPPGPSVPVRVTGSLHGTEEGVLLCPGSVAPCWPVVGDTEVDATGELVVVTGEWDRDSIRVDAVDPGPEPGFDFTNPCLPDGDSADEVWQDSAAFDEYAASIPEHLAGVWRDEGMLVVAVTADKGHHRAELDRLGVEGVCVADLGFDHTLVELEAAIEDMAERWPAWGERGWVVLSGSIDVSANQVLIAFDQIDQELRDEIESTWGDLVEIRSNVEVLDGPVDQLEVPGHPDEITIATQPRGAGGMDALGHFTLRFDDERECLWLEDEEGARVKPIWPHGFRALPGPARVLDGRDEVVAVADGDLEIAGGYGQVLPDSDDPADCAAESVWVINPN